MPYRTLYIFVEGPDDERFFGKIIKPRFEGKYQYVRIITYKKNEHRDKHFVIRFIRNIKSPSWPADYLFVSDINNSPCATAKKQKEQRIFNNILDSDRIIIVKMGIESWYKAGLSDDKCQQLKIPPHSNTDNLTKEDFNSLIPNIYDKLPFKLKILDCFSAECAINRNNSFKYFIEKYDC